MTANLATVTTARPLSKKLLLKHAWIDRDLSWLQFNLRVLSEAFDERNPLLERLKFLAIFSSNLDEFYMKRVSALRDNEIPEDDEDPLTRDDDASVRFARIRAEVSTLLERQATCYLETLLPALAKHGIRLATWESLSAAEVWTEDRWR